jgi:pyruvate/2-oxoglutarate dehydrogenase complex dihydrolipoamide dehydrogenase (E3) component
MENIKTDICVIGAGSGGLVIAAAVASFGVNVVLIENRKMGGECLNYGCVPSKSLITVAKIAHTLKEAEKYGLSIGDVSVNYEKIHQYVQSVISRISSHDSKERFEKLGVRVFIGKSKFLNKRNLSFNDKINVQARRFVIATGSSPVIPNIPGLKDTQFLTNETIFELKEKVKHLLVIGGGPVGCELAQAYRFLGAKVSIIQRSRLLKNDEPECVDILRKVLIEQGIDVYEELEIKSIGQTDDGISITILKSGKDQTIVGSHVLVATGRKPNTQTLALEAAGIAYDASGIIVDKRLRTSNKYIFAIGDVIKDVKFTHMAAYEASVVLQNILFRRHKVVDKRALPWVTYTTPQLAHVGLTEKEIAGKKSAVIITKTFTDNDRAQTEGDTIGGIKLIATKKGKVLGVSILGSNVDNLIGLWSLVITQQLPLSQVAELIMPYPTRQELSKAIAIEFYRPLLSSKWLRRIVKFLQWF